MTSSRTRRFRVPAALLAGVLITALAACGGSRTPPVLLPPRVDLAPHNRIGLVLFTAEKAKGSLAALATQRFMEQLLRAQPGIEVLELGAIAGPIDAAAARRIGAEQGVRTIAVGHIVVSDLKPRVSMSGGLSASAEGTVTLTTRLLSAESGATLWSQSSRIRQTMGSIGVVDGQAVFGAQDPQEAYGAMVDELVSYVTDDFKSHYARR
ncbi:MAG: hypothetical protein OEW77_08885 [Gemmatimonadota bacterium]|nr:hypothetical protein [Gemmatimonadota bacterium]